MSTAPTGRDPVAGRIVATVEIPARHGAAVPVARGQVLRVMFNVFMQWPVEPDGTVIPMAAPSHAGDYADFLAEMHLIVANSACPSDITPTNAHHPTPMRFVVYEPGP